MRLCSIGGCVKPHYAHGWCQMHYRRWKRWGDPEEVVVQARGTCRVCGEPMEAKDLCRIHYNRVRHRGTVAEPPPRARPLEARFWEKVDRTLECWFWRGTLNSAGYGVFHIYGQGTKLAHRLAYELLVGPIPDDTLDHLCYVRNCVNPAHLEPCSLLENQRRARERVA